MSEALTTNQLLTNVSYGVASEFTALMIEVGGANWASNVFLGSPQFAISFFSEYSSATSNGYKDNVAIERAFLSAAIDTIAVIGVKTAAVALTDSIVGIPVAALVITAEGTETWQTSKENLIDAIISSQSTSFGDLVANTQVSAPGIQLPSAVGSMLRGFADATQSQSVITSFINNAVSGAQLDKNLTQFWNPCDPMVISLDGKPITTTAVSAGTYLDYGNDGFQEATSWFGANAGVLVLVTNPSGSLNNGISIIGNNTSNQNGTVQGSSGFAQLQALANGRNFIDASNPNFANIQVWVQGQGGANGAMVLKTLAQLGIQSIGLATTNVNAIDANGDTITQSATITYANGTTGTLFEYTMAVNNSNTIDESASINTSAYSSIPDVAGWGGVHSLKVACALDTTGNLGNLVNQYLAATPAQQATLINNLILTWAGVINNAQWRVANSNYTGDSRIIDAISQFVGAGYQNYNFGASTGIITAYGVIQINMAWNNLISYVNSYLINGTQNQALLNLVTTGYNQTTGQTTYNVSALITALSTASAATLNSFTSYLIGNTNSLPIITAINNYYPTPSGSFQWSMAGFAAAFDANFNQITNIGANTLNSQNANLSTLYVNGSGNTLNIGSQGIANYGAAAALDARVIVYGNNNTVTEAQYLHATKNDNLLISGSSDTVLSVGNTNTLNEYGQSEVIAFAATATGNTVTDSGQSGSIKLVQATNAVISQSGVANNTTIGVAGQNLRNESGSNLTIAGNNNTVSDNGINNTFNISSSYESVTGYWDSQSNVVTDTSQSIANNYGFINLAYANGVVVTQSGIGNQTTIGNLGAGGYGGGGGALSSNDKVTVTGSNNQINDGFVCGTATSNNAINVKGSLNLLNNNASNGIISIVGNQNKLTNFASKASVSIAGDKNTVQTNQSGGFINELGSGANIIFAGNNAIVNLTDVSILNSSANPNISIANASSLTINQGGSGNVINAGFNSSTAIGSIAQSSVSTTGTGNTINIANSGATSVANDTIFISGNLNKIADGLNNGSLPFLYNNLNSITVSGANNNVANAGSGNRISVGGSNEVINNNGSNNTYSLLDINLNLSASSATTSSTVTGNGSTGNKVLLNGAASVNLTESGLNNNIVVGSLRQGNLGPTQATSAVLSVSGVGNTLFEASNNAATTGTNASLSGSNNLLMNSGTSNTFNVSSNFESISASSYAQSSSITDTSQSLSNDQGSITIVCATKTTVVQSGIGNQTTIGSLGTYGNIKATNDSVIVSGAHNHVNDAYSSSVNTSANIINVSGSQNFLNNAASNTRITISGLQNTIQTNQNGGSINELGIGSNIVFAGNNSAVTITDTSTQNPTLIPTINLAYASNLTINQSGSGNIINAGYNNLYSTGFITQSNITTGGSGNILNIAGINSGYVSGNNISVTGINNILNNNSSNISIVETGTSTSLNVAGTSSGLTIIDSSANSSITDSYTTATSITNVGSANFISTGTSSGSGTLSNSSASVNGINNTLVMAGAGARNTTNDQITIIGSNNSVVVNSSNEALIISASNQNISALSASGIKQLIFAASSANPNNVLMSSLLFSRSGNDLDIFQNGTRNEVIETGWFTRASSNQDTIITSEGRNATCSQINSLISAMASIAPPVAGQNLTFTPAQQTQVNNALAAAGVH